MEVSIPKFVNDPVAESADARRIYVGVSHSECFGKLARGLTDDLEIACDRIDGFFVAFEIFESLARRVPPDLPGGFEDVLEKEC